MMTIKLGGVIPTISRLKVGCEKLSMIEIIRIRLVSERSFNTLVNQLPCTADLYGVRERHLFAIISAELSFLICLC
jgi:hypothetical protein